MEVTGAAVAIVGLAVGLLIVDSAAVQRNYRQMLWEYREYAKRLKEYAVQEMRLYLQMPYELPRYFASFDHPVVTGK